MDYILKQVPDANATLPLLNFCASTVNRRTLVPSIFQTITY